MARVTLFIGGPRAVLDRCDNGVETAQNARKRKGRDSNPGDRSRGLTVFKTAAFNRSATLPRQWQCYAVAHALHGCPGLYTGLHAQGEVAERLKALAC